MLDQLIETLKVLYLSLLLMMGVGANVMLFVALLLGIHALKSNWRRLFS